MVNLELYRIFIVVAKEKNLSKASKILNISQPAITKHIKNLENELQTTLFIRSRGMNLTSEGKELYERILPAINTIEEAENNLHINRNIRLGTYPTMLIKVLSDCIAEFYKDNEKTKIIAITEPINELFNNFLNHELDIVILRKQKELKYNSKEIKYIKLGEVEYVLIVNNQSNLCGRKIELEDLKNKIIYVPRAISESIMSTLNNIGINNEIKKIDSVTMLNIIQKHKDCIGLVNKSYIRDELKLNKVTLLEKNFILQNDEFGIYIHKDNKFPKLEELIKILENNNYN